MRYRKLLTSAILTSAVCLISVFVLVQPAGAWAYKAFSGLCASGSYRGQLGETIDFIIRDFTVHVQCTNINTDNQWQPGDGNSGTAEFSADTFADPDKHKGIVSFEGCLDTGLWDDHQNHLDYSAENDGAISPFHICTPIDNPNKWEVLATAYFRTFTAEWWMYDSNGNQINHGTDVCTWTGELVGGYPEHDVPFTCTSTSDKKINFYNK